LFNSFNIEMSSSDQHSYLDNDSPQLESMVFDSAVISNLHPNSMRALNTYRETVYIRKTVPALESFRTAYRFLSLYFKRRGLYSAKFGYLGGVHLLLMLNRIAKLMATRHSGNDIETSNEKCEPEISPASFVRTFFKYYAEFDWQANIVEDPNPANRALPIKRSVREPVVIRAIFSPTARPNVAASCSSMSARTFASEFELAKQKLDAAQWRWCLRPEKENVSDFLNDAEAFVKIKVELWDLEKQSSDQIRDIVGSLESRIPLILVSLARSEDIIGRVWPARFRTSEDDSDGTAVSGYYLIAVNMKHGEDDPDVDKKTVIGGKVLSAAREFEGIIQHSKNSRNQNVWVSVEVTSKKRVWDMGMFLDDRDWSRLATGIAVPTVPSADEEKSGESGQTLSKPGEFESSQVVGSGSKKLRPIQDVISRLRWDSSYSEDDYVIGYEDRFVGIKEINLTDWKNEQTDLEFIPSHRIVWVRKKGDGGEKIWDRRTRFDALFGSGNTRSGT
jgi:uncharacterized protein (UPF0248 family)